MYEILKLYNQPQDHFYVQDLMSDLHSQVVNKARKPVIIMTRFNSIKTTGMLGQSKKDIVKDMRGGGDTFHDPGQIVVYPILPLDLIQSFFDDEIDSYTKFLQTWLERIITELGFAIDKNYSQHYGVWVDGFKVAFVGARIKQRVSMHGFAINLNTDLGKFTELVPCGLTGVKIGNLGVDLELCANCVIRKFEELTPLSTVAV